MRRQKSLSWTPQPELRQTKTVSKPPFFKPGLSIKNGCFLFGENSFLLVGAFIRQYYFCHFGFIFGHNSAFMFVFVKSSEVLQQREVILLCFVRKKRFWGAQKHPCDFWYIFFVGQCVPLDQVLFVSICIWVCVFSGVFHGFMCFFLWGLGFFEKKMQKT